MSQAAFFEMHYVIKYVLDTRNIGLKLEPIEYKKEPWNTVCFRSSNYAAYTVSRRSVSEFILSVLVYLSLGNQKNRQTLNYPAQCGMSSTFGGSERNHICEFAA